MIKLLITIILSMFSWNSYAETFVCSYINGGSIETIRYQREGNAFMESMAGYDMRFRVPIYDESEEVLALLSKNIPGLGIHSIYIDKKTREYSSTIIRARISNVSHGMCEVIY